MSFYYDSRRGQSLVVWAIAEGRQAARQIDKDLMGHTSLAGPGGIRLAPKYIRHYGDPDQKLEEWAPMA